MPNLPPIVYGVRWILPIWAAPPYPALDGSALQWHVNDGEEVFAVMSGTVDIHYREHGQEQVVRLQVGYIFFAGIGTEHVAHPQGEARILVIEKEGRVQAAYHARPSENNSRSGIDVRW